MDCFGLRRRADRWDPIFCGQERDAGEFDGTLFNGLGADEVPLV